jgi:hypothetical protein
MKIAVFLGYDAVCTCSADVVEELTASIFRVCIHDISHTSILKTARILYTGTGLRQVIALFSRERQQCPLEGDLMDPTEVEKKVFTAMTNTSLPHINSVKMSSGTTSYSDISVRFT